MLKDKRFWLGFLIGYLIVATIPAANVLARLRKGGGGGGQ